MNKVLIIDDENQLRGLLSRIIGLEGYEVFQADSCTAGLKQAKQCMPDVVLCDVRLPDGNGMEIIERLKQLVSSCGDYHAYGTWEYSGWSAGDKKRSF